MITSQHGWLSAKMRGWGFQTSHFHRMIHHHPCNCGTTGPVFPEMCVLTSVLNTHNNCTDKKLNPHIMPLHDHPKSENENGISVIQLSNSIKRRSVQKIVTRMDWYYSCQQHTECGRTYETKCNTLVWSKQ